MRSKRYGRQATIGSETSRVLDYALSGVARELARLLKQHLKRRRRTLTHRGETGVSKRDVFRLLRKAFSNAMLKPRGNVTGAAKQRSALLFALAAANVPSALNASGIPTEIFRARRRRRGR